MHPVIFVGSSVLLGLLFALQAWFSVHMWNYRMNVPLLLEAWGLQYFLWGVLCWLLWWWLGPVIQRATWAWIISRMLPLSIFACLAEELIWVLFFPNLPVNQPHMDYWHRIEFQLDGEFFDSILIFWCAVALFRSIGYYQKFREKETTAAQLEVQLATAKISALRMQLNPHFLFNTMNSISSLMRTDIDAADTMLEQLGSLLRITLDRGDAQFVALREEMDFIEMYLAMQERRFGGRVRQSLIIDPELYDALVPAMILQPIVENAYVHGLSKLDNGGTLEIEARRDGLQLNLSVLNSGVGLQLHPIAHSEHCQGVGLANVKSRLLMHYGAHQTFAIREIGRNCVQVSITLPLEVSQNHAEEITRFGA